MEKIILTVFAFIFGSLIGSFLNVCIYRIPKKLAPLGRSHCPHCGKMIPLYRNIPLVSFIIQKGKSACCQKKISFQYPLVEFITGILSVSTLFHFAYLAEQNYFFTANPLYHYFIWFLFFICPLVVIAFIDAEHLIIPDVIVLPSILIGIAVQIFEKFPVYNEALLFSGIGILVGAGSLLLIVEIVSRLKKQDAMGGGDIKLTAMLGAFVGIKALVFILMTASFLGLSYIAYLAVLKKYQRNQVIPFGPFLSFGAIAYFLLFSRYFYSVVTIHH